MKRENVYNFYRENPSSYIETIGIKHLIVKEIYSKKEGYLYATGYKIAWVLFDGDGYCTKTRMNFLVLNNLSQEEIIKSSTSKLNKLNLSIVSEDIFNAINKELHRRKQKGGNND